MVNMSPVETSGRAKPRKETKPVQVPGKFQPTHVVKWLSNLTAVSSSLEEFTTEVP